MAKRFKKIVKTEKTQQKNLAKLLSHWMQPSTLNLAGVN
jgi:hypothetical protein